MSGFGEVPSAARARDIFERIAEGVVNKLRPEPFLAKVYDIDTTAQTARVLLAGETLENLMTVNYALDKKPQSMMAYDLNSGLAASGDVVRVGGRPGSYYIMDFFSGGPLADSITPGLRVLRNMAQTSIWDSVIGPHLVIQTNQMFSNIMTKVTIRGRHYQIPYDMVDIDVAYYAYGASQNFHNYQAQNKGTFWPESVRLAKRTSDGKIAIIVTVHSTAIATWNYAHVTVDGMFQSNVEANLYLDEFKGWTATFTSDISAYTIMQTPAIADTGTDTGWITTTGVASGWTGTVRYRRIAGVVHMNFDVHKASWALNEVAATVLPVGYRPAYNSFGMGQNGDVNNAPRGFWISTAGEIRAAIADVNSIYGSISFPAA